MIRVLAVLTLAWKSVWGLDAAWIRQFPVGLQLITGDLLRFPIDDYVNTKGSTFTIAAPGSQSWIIPKLNPGTTNPLRAVGASTPNSCSIILRPDSTSNYLIMLCSKNMLYKVYLSNTWMYDSTATDLSLQIGTSTTVCTDMIITPAVSAQSIPTLAHLLCMDTAPAATGYTISEVEIDSATWTQGSTNHDNANLGTATVNKSGYPKFTIAFISSGAKYVYFIWDAVPAADASSATPAVTTSGFQRCTLSTSGYSMTCAGTPASLTSIVTPASNFGSVRYLKIFDNSGTNLIFYAVASGVAGSRNITLGFLGIDASDNPVSLGATTVAYATPYSFNLTQWVSDADANAMMGHIFMSGNTGIPSVSNMDHFILVGRTNVIYVSLSPTVTVNGVNNLAGPTPRKDWSSPFECTMPATAIPTRCIDLGGSMTKYDSRLVVEYRNPSVGGYLDNLAAVGVNFNYTKYGCYPTANGYPSGVFISSFSNLVTFLGSNFIPNKMSPDTLLSIPVQNAGTTPVMDMSVSITAKTTDSGNPTPAKVLNFKVAKTPLDYNNISLDTNYFRAYNGSNFTLPISPRRFNTNGPQLTIKSNPDGVVLLNLTSPSAPFVFPMNFTTPYSYSRLLLADKDWAIVVLKSSGAPDKEFFALVKVSYDSNGVPSFPIPGDWTKDPKIKATDSGEKVYKVLRLYDSVCVFFRGFNPSQARLRLNCYKLAIVTASATTDYPSVFTYANAATTPATILASNVELVEMGYMLTSTNLTYYIICNPGTGSGYDVRVGSITVTPSGSAASYTNPVQLSTAVTLLTQGETLLDGYFPIDIVVDYWGDIEGMLMVTMRMYRQSMPPVLARYIFMSMNNQIYGVLLRMMRIETHNIIYCPQKDEVVFYNPRARQIYSVAWNLNSAMASGLYKFVYPLSQYKVASIMQFNCIPERGMFQILAKTSDSPSKKIVVSFNGGYSWVGGKRVHSVTDVHIDTELISTSSNSGSVYMYTGTSLNPASANNQYFAMALYGPLLRVVGPATPQNVTVDVSSLPKNALAGATAAQASFVIDLTSAITFAMIYPKIKFDLTKGAVIKLDDRVDLPGPVIWIKKEGTTSENIELLPRISKFRAYTPTSQTVAQPTKVITDGDFMITIMSSTGDCLILGDPAVLRPNVPTTSVPITIQELQTVKNAHLVKLPNSTDAVAVVVTYSITPGQPTTYYYDLYHLNVTAPAAGSTGTNTYGSNRTAGDTLFQTQVDYDTIHIVYITGKGIVMAMSFKREFASNLVKLVYLRREPGLNWYTKVSECFMMTIESMDIGDYFLTTVVNNATNMAYATIIGHFKMVPGFFVAHWDLVADSISPTRSYTNMTTPAGYVNSSTPETSKLLNFNYIKCWPRYDLQMSVDCVINAEGAIDFGLLVEFNLPANDDSEPIKTITKTAEFETPPRFDVRRIDRSGDYVGFHLVRNEPILVAPTAIKKFDDCMNIIAYYKPGKNRYIYTSTMCDSFGTSFDSMVEFAMGTSSDASSYSYYTNTRSTLEKIKCDMLNSALLTVKDKLQADKIKLTFIGLNGEDSSENQFMFLDELRFGGPPAPSSSTWVTWLIVLGVFILIGVGGYAAWMWYQNQQAAAGSSAGSGYHAPDAHNKSDLEDSRL